MSKNIEKLKKELGYCWANEVESSQRLSTGLPTLDIALGGGWPKGRISLITGFKESGKSYLSYKAIAETHKDPETLAILLDAERAYTPQWGEAIGIDNTRLIVHRPITMEVAYNSALQMLSEFRPSVIVFDSLASLAPGEEIEKELGESRSRAGAAILTNTFLRMIFSLLNQWPKDASEPVIIMIQHLYMDPSVPYFRTRIRGGVGQEYMAALILQTAQAEGRQSRLIETVKIKNQEIDRHVGWNFKWSIEKSRIGPSGISGTYNLYTRNIEEIYKEGQSDDLETLIFWAVNFGLIEKHASWYSWQEEKYQGLEDLKAAIRGSGDILQNQVTPLLMDFYVGNGGLLAQYK